MRLGADKSLETLGGHLPAWWKGQPAGFECDHWDAYELMTEFREVDFGRQWAHALAFRWGADLKACLGAYIAATAYAVASDGIVFDCEEGRIKTPEQARETSRKIEAEIPMFEDRMKEILGKLAADRAQPKLDK